MKYDEYGGEIEEGDIQRKEDVGAGEADEEKDDDIQSG